MIEGAAGIIVAVSGGADSVTLLDMILRLSSGTRGWGLGVGEEGDPAALQDKQRPLSSSAFISNPQPRTPNPNIHVAHLDHRLRGRESTEHAEFVREVAEKLELPVTIGSIDIRAAAEIEKRGLEEVAREIRYGFLTAVARERGCDRIAVGHTMTDQAETVLMRLIRGAGIPGLAAMRPVVPAHTFREASEQKAELERQKGESGAPEGHLDLPSDLAHPPSISIIRPLLSITRDEIEAYCRERALEFRTDTTNSSLDYTRNRIRNEVLPTLIAINPRAIESIARAAENIASDRDGLESVACSLLAGARLDSAFERLESGSGNSEAREYAVSAMLEQPPGMRRRMIMEAIRLARNAVGQRICREVTSKHVIAVEGLLEPHSSGKRIRLPDGLEVWREFDGLVFKPARLSEAWYERTISAARPNAEAAGFAFMLERSIPGRELKSVIAEAKREGRSTERDWMIAAFDDRDLPEQLVIRPRLKGERAHVIGQQRTKKLKNLMIDHRIPSSRRDNWPVVTAPDGGYIWSPGLPPSMKFAARDKTQCLAILRASVI